MAALSVTGVTMGMAIPRPARTKQKLMSMEVGKVRHYRSQSIICQIYSKMVSFHILDDLLYQIPHTFDSNVYI
jgi:hypothetical protein